MVAAAEDDPARHITSTGEGNQLELAAGVITSGRIEISGNGNRVVLAPGVRVEKYAPAGFSATVPDLGRRSDAALVIEGDGNVIEVEADVRLALNLVVRGHRNRVRIGSAAYLHGFANLITDDALLSVGARTTMVQGSLQLHEPTSLTIGEDCMISSQVFVAVSDMHPIFDRDSGARLNPGDGVSVGDHVWLGLRTMVLKGSSIGTGAITAAGSIVSGSIPANVIVAGAPARVVRRNVEWSRDLHDAGPGMAPVGDRATVRSYRSFRWWPFAR